MALGLTLCRTKGSEEPCSDMKSDGRRINWRIHPKLFEPLI